MTSEERISELEQRILTLEYILENRTEAIDHITERIDFFYEWIKLNNNRHKDNEGRIDFVAEKALMTYYKLFPEAIEADKALERIVRDQGKKSKN